MRYTLSSQSLAPAKNTQKTSGNSPEKDKVIENLRKEIISLYSILEKEREEWTQREMNQDRLVQKLIQEREASRKAEECHSEITKKLNESAFEAANVTKSNENLQMEMRSLQNTVANLMETQQELEDHIKRLSAENSTLKNRPRYVL